MLNTPSPLPQVGCIESLPRAAVRPRRSRGGRRSLLSVLAVGAMLFAAFPSAAGAGQRTRRPYVAAYLYGGDQECLDVQGGWSRP